MSDTVSFSTRNNVYRPQVREVGSDADLDTHEMRAALSVVLVRGPIVSTARAVNNEAVPALGLAYISGFLRKHGYANVQLVDGTGEALNETWPIDLFPGYQCQGLTFEEICERIPENTSVIGFSAMFSGEWPVQRELLRAIRVRAPDAVIICGGEHITAMTEHSLRDCSAIDYCVRGEGEYPFFHLVEAIRTGAPIDHTPSVAYLDADGRYVETSNAIRIADIDNIGWPHWPDGYLEGFWKEGKSYGVQTERDMPMMMSRGCPFQCTFCSNPFMWTTRYVVREVDDAINEIKTYQARFGITAVQLYDLTAIVKRQWIIDFCETLIREGIEIQWSLPSGTRSEALDEETLTLLRRTGCNYLVYAPESGSTRTLATIKKRISLDRLTQSVLAAKKVGLVLRCNLIIGFPFEKRSDIFRTILYGLKLAAKGVDEVSINIFSPYPGSELFEGLRESRRLEIDDNYFLSLTSLNSDYTRMNPLTFNQYIGPRELAFFRILFMMTNYSIGYLLFPKRVLRTIRSVFMGQNATTVLEHRLKDLFARRRRAPVER